MKGLLAGPTNNVKSIVSTKLVTRSSILEASKTEAATTSTYTNTTELDIKTNPDAQEEADRINMFRLAAIGAKEGAAA